MVKAQTNPSHSTPGSAHNAIDAPNSRYYQLTIRGKVSSFLPMLFPFLLRLFKGSENLFTLNRAKGASCCTA